MILILVGSCVDAPSALRDSEATPMTLTLAASLSLQAPQPSASAAAADALSAAFDRVDRFQLTVVRAGGGETLLETVITVTPGQEAYDLTVTAEGVLPGEEVLVTVAAFEGSTLLFRSDPIRVTARSPGVTGTSDPEPVSISLVYAGPGADAASVELDRDAAVLGSGASVQLSATVRSTDGTVIAGVPLGWSVASGAVASVDADGTVTGVGSGRTTVTVTTPSGQSAATEVYVVAGRVAFERSGSVVERDVSGGAETPRGAGARPAWDPAGTRLLVERGGAVVEAGSGVTLFDGSSPAVSPDQTKIAASSGGSLVFANADGSRVTPGPAGETPQWRSSSELVVGGGSVDRVRADGSGRTTLASGAMWPAVAGDGRVAWVQGGNLVVDGGAPLTGGVDSRPSWSPDGLWLLASVGGVLHLVPAEGSGPAASLEVQGTFPAWQPTGGAAGAPAGLVLTGFDPADPVPGAAVSILGSGFDWIIPANNRVVFPGPEGDVEADILDITEASIRVRVPSPVAQGVVRVTTFSDQATLSFTPALASVAVTARTPAGEPVAGLRVIFSSGGVDVIEVTTDEDGTALAGDLGDGVYRVTAVAPVGFQVVGVPPTVTVAAGTAASLQVVVQPLVQILTISPDVPLLNVGETVEVTASATDINGNPVAAFVNSTWVALGGQVQVNGSGLHGTLTGAYPTTGQGDARFRIFLNDQIFDFGATVRSHISGVVRKVDPEVEGGAPQPAAGVTIQLVKDGLPVAQATTDAQGNYRFSGLAEGAYGVFPLLPEGVGSAPGSVDIPLGAAAPTGRADFIVSKATLNYGFETPLPGGWEATGLWNRTTGQDIVNVAVGGQAALAPGDESGGALPEALEGDWYMWYGDPSRGNFDVGTTSGTVTTPAFVVPASGAAFSVRYWFEIEAVAPASYDIMEVQVLDLTADATIVLARLNPSQSVGGGAQQPFTSGGFNAPPVWKNAGVDLSAFAGHEIRGRVVFRSGDSNYNYFRGFIIDDLRLITAGAPPSSASSLQKIDRARLLDLTLPAALRRICHPVGCAPEPLSAPIRERNPARPDAVRREGNAARPEAIRRDP